MKEFLENQYKNLFLWSPFVMAFGAALYFSLNTEPNFYHPILISLLLGIIILKNTNIIIRALAIFMFGFFYSMSFTQIVNTPQIRDSFGAIDISGKITNIDYANDTTRVLLQVPFNQIESNDNLSKPVNIRISLKDDNLALNIGDTIQGKAMLFRPSERFTPDSFDFARWAYFNKISGTGFFTDYKITPSQNNNLNIRNLLHIKTKSNLVDTLVLGYKKSLPKNEIKIWQSVGLGHVWSISGFHMTLVGGWLFVIFYLIFRSIAPITKRIPAKYPSIICAWFGLLLYLFISGTNVATIRAFLMTTLIFTATLFGRGILSLRNAAIAFIVLFLINPFYVMHAGFQLSFAAIFGLLWFFDDKQYVKREPLQHILHILFTTLMTTIVATLFTLPFIIAHFGYIPIYGLFGNLIILPMFSFAIMPCIMIGVIFALFGNNYFIELSHTLYGYALNIAEHINNLPFANLQMPHISNISLIFCIIGILAIILTVKKDSENFVMKNINYFIGGVFIMIGTSFCVFAPKPLFYSTPDHKLVGFINNNKIKFNKASSSKHFFAFNSWKQFNNEKTDTKNIRQKCTKGLCIYKTPKWNLAYMQHFTTVMDNAVQMCDDKNIDFIISPFDLDTTNCHAKILQNGVLIYPSGHIANIINHRPWHNLPAQNKDQMQVH